jgi:hypothetical protein
MYYSTRRGYLNIILIIIILLALFVLVSWLAYNAGTNVAEGRGTDSDTVKIISNPLEVGLTTISLAQNAQLQRTTGAAKVGREESLVEIDILLEDNAVIPEGSVLAAWLVDAGKKGGLGETSVTDLDQQYGTPFANVNFSGNVDDAPYALSLGTLAWNTTRGSFHIFYNGNDSLVPFDAVMVTLESDGNNGNFDPRPGTPILIGEIK